MPSFNATIGATQSIYDPAVKNEFVFDSTERLLY